MNCALHPERPASAFCQNCGKALCPECTRSADGLLLCEPCLLLRYPQAQAAGADSGWSAVGGASGGSYPAPSAGSGQAPYTPVSNAAARSAPGGRRGRPSPVLAGFLGLLFPGVGAMYNGQFVKALLHVIVFVVLIGITQHFEPGGILIAAWIFYQVFDAAQTAAARRDGLPLPDPFGILDLSRRMGPPTAAYTPPPAYVPAPPPAGPGWSDPYAPPPASPQMVRRGEPVGALVLIAVGLLFLMSTLGLFDVDWIGRLWPVLPLLLGVWLLVRRARSPYPAPPPVMPGPEPMRRSPFPIPPDPVPGAAGETSAAVGEAGAPRKEDGR